ncbi:MAG: methionine biosynthesis protein MetW [Candidatus Methanoperedens sp.]|jgi:methionine biosynthesis protein MetW|nr:methionine biosynthesis protein MetW [Candidatus Methanoperedens sp.]
MIDDPTINNNREYNYTGHETQYRDEYPIIEDLIKPNSKVIDLGCGNGSLLQLLKDKKNIQEYGIELVRSGVDMCLEKGLNVRQGSIDCHLSEIEDKQFDYAICNVTIQMVMYPEVLLSEMKRIAHYQIISFPNFANWRNRLDLLLRGRMPKPMLFGYDWYNTGHIHQLSVKDFLDLAEKCDLTVCRQIHIGIWSWIGYIRNWNSNLFSTISIYLLKDKL